MTIEGSSRSKSALSFGIKEESKNSNKKSSKKFRQNIHFNNNSAINSNEDLIALTN